MFHFHNGNGYVSRVWKNVWICHWQHTKQRETEKKKKKKERNECCLGALINVSNMNLSIIFNDCIPRSLSFSSLFVATAHKLSQTLNKKKSEWYGFCYYGHFWSISFKFFSLLQTIDYHLRQRMFKVQLFYSLENKNSF